MACTLPLDLDDVVDDDDAAEAQLQEDAFQRMYANDHTWEALKEDEHGMLRVDRSAEQRARRRRVLATAAQQGHIRRGMIRYLLLVIDLSAAASASDLRPTRLAAMLRAAQDFVRAYFDQNPLSQMGILGMRGGVCVRLTELSASPEAQLRRLEVAALAAEGAASLANALDMCVALLRNIPPYGHREVVLLFAALSTCDPGNIFDSIKAAKAAHIRVSVVGVAAEVHVCRRLADATGGQYAVAVDEQHLADLLRAHAAPPALLEGEAGCELVGMGFPQRGPDHAGAAVFVGPDARLLPGSYVCPRCKARVPELPSECHVCGLTLIASPHLARSYHHLFPIPTYAELSPQQLAAALAERRPQPANGAAGLHVQDANVQAAAGELRGAQLQCFGCLRALSVQRASGGGHGSSTSLMVLRCPTCRHLFCFDCDVYVHESLHNCPGCECMPPLQSAGR